MSKLMKIFLGLVTVCVLAAGALLAATRSDAAVTVVYIGAHNCSVCPTFERETWKPFLDTDLGRRATTREVMVRSFARINNPEEWPEDLRWMIAASQIRAGTPLVLVFKGDRLAARGDSTAWSWNLSWRIALADAGWVIAPRTL